MSSRDPPPHRRSPVPSSSRRRSRSPPPSRRRSRSPHRKDDRDSYRPDSRRDEPDRRGGYGGDRGVERGGREDRRERRRSRSPPPRQAVAPLAPAGDGGWGVRGTSPGRPSLALALPSQASLAGGPEGEEGPAAVKVVEPNFAPSGALAAETNTFQGVVLKYNEPPEARKPVRSWRLYVFKGKEQVDLFHVHKQSAYLVGRDRIVADIPVDHPSTSKQHAVLQFRQVIERNEFGETKSLTKPFVIDLDSANGTTVNDEMVPPSRYYELKSGDVLKFAFSTREYVLLAET